MYEFLMAFLKGLEMAVPPPVNCHHAITFAQYGSAEAGWEDKLALQVNKEGQFHCFFLDRSDLSLSVDDLILNIFVELQRYYPAAQLGVGLGQYLPVEE